MIEEDKIRSIVKSELYKFKKELISAKTMYVQKLTDVELPKYANDTDAGMDLRASADVEIAPGETKVIPTGIKVVIPNGYELQVRARSGISMRTPLRISNGIGTIDSGYRGEIGVIITNTSKEGNEEYDLDAKGNKEGIYKIKKGDKIAQIVLCKYEKISLEMIEDVNEYTSSRKGGFGSTGTR